MNQIATAVQLACVDIYAPINQSAFEHIFQIGETVCGAVIIDGNFYIVNQGTSNIPGWVADFDIEMIHHPVLGGFHAGFNLDADALLGVLLPLIPNGMPVYISGHSKGAGEAAILSAKLKLSGVNVVRNNLFACPNAGDQYFSNWLNKNIPGISFRNEPTEEILEWAGDPVPLVPVEPFVPPYVHTAINCDPDSEKRYIAVEWHNSSLYLSGVLDWLKSHS